jgi:CMP-N-acetylneuraminic acid synthetase
MKILGVIPARAGSKGVPRKNVRLVGGRPLIAWTWDAARAATGVSRLVVSTDDPEVALLARAARVEVPFLRPAELANDAAASIDVAVHALEWLDRAEGYRPDLVLWLQPTSPLRTTSDVEAAVALQRDRNADAVVSVTPAPHPPAWLQRLGGDGTIEPYFPELAAGTRRQDQPQAYVPNGAIFLTRRSVLLDERTFYPRGRTLGLVMGAERSLDVDTPWDLHLADLVLANRAATP